MCGSYIFGWMCVEYSNRLCVKAIYLLCKAIYYLFNIFKERKSIVCKLSTRVYYIVNNYKEYIYAINTRHWDSFHVRKPHKPFDLIGLEMKSPSLYFNFELEIIECLLNVS